MSEALAKALSHPLRRQILVRLAEQPGSAKQLSTELEVDIGNVAYHMGRLRELDLLRLVRTKKRRGAVERIYKAAPAAPLIATTLEPKDVPVALRSHISVPTLQAIISSGIAALKAGTLDARDDGHLVCVPTVLDQEGWGDIAAIMDQTLTRIATARTRSAKRLSKTGQSKIHATIVLANFESSAIAEGSS